MLSLSSGDFEHRSRLFQQRKQGSLPLASFPLVLEVNVGLGCGSETQSLLNIHVAVGSVPGAVITKQDLRVLGRELGGVGNLLNSKSTICYYSLSENLQQVDGCIVPLTHFLK